MSEMESFSDLNSETAISTPSDNRDFTVEGESVSFNDLDDVDNARKDLQKAKDESKKIQQQPKDNPDKPPKAETSSKEKSAKNTGKEAPPTDQEVEQEIKRLKASFNDEELDIPADAQFTAKVKGEEHKVGLQELINNYSGKTQWLKKFNELSDQRQQIQPIQENFSKFKELASSDNPIDAINLALDMGQVDAHTFYNKLKDFIIPNAEEYFNMTDEERRSSDLERENEFLRNKSESYLSNQRQQSETAKLASEINQIRETHKISEQEIKYAYEQLVDNGTPDISPQMLADFAISYRDAVRIENLLHSIDPNLLNEDRIFNAICDISKSNPDLTDKELADTVRSVFGAGDDKKRLANRKNATTTKRESASIQTKDTKDFLTFDDFDD